MIPCISTKLHVRVNLSTLILYLEDIPLYRSITKTGINLTIHTTRSKSTKHSLIIQLSNASA